MVVNNSAYQSLRHTWSFSFFLYIFTCLLAMCGLFCPACVLCASGSSAGPSLFRPGFQAFSDFFSWTSSFTDTFMMIFLGGGRRGPMLIICKCNEKKIKRQFKWLTVAPDYQCFPCWLARWPGCYCGTPQCQLPFPKRSHLAVERTQT